MAERRSRPDPGEDPVRSSGLRGRISGTFPLQAGAHCPRDVLVVVVRKGPPILLGGPDILFPWEVLWLESEDGHGYCLPRAASPFRHLDVAAAERAAIEVLRVPIAPLRLFPDAEYRGGRVSVVQACPAMAIAPPAEDEDAPSACPVAHWIRWLPSDDERRRMSDDDLDLVALVLEVRAGRGIISACSS